MSHKRGHDRRARDKQEIRATHAADLKDSAERFVADWRTWALTFDGVKALALARRRKMRRFFLRCVS